MYNPGTQVQIPADANVGSYYLLKKLAVGVFPTAFLSKKKKSFAYNVGLKSFLYEKVLEQKVTSEFNNLRFLNYLSFLIF
jgi:hypothetical protein